MAKSFDALKRVGLGKEDYHLWKVGKALLCTYTLCRCGMIGTTIGPKGIIESDKDSYNYEKALQDRKVNQEAFKLWTRMRNEVISKLLVKGFEVG